MEKRSFKEKLINEYMGKFLVTLCGLLIMITTVTIIFFVAKRGVMTFVKGNSGVIDFIFTDNWEPSIDNPSFGALSFILGSTIVAIGAVVFSAPIAIALGLFVNIISKSLGNKIIKPALEILVGIPSVVYGWVGVTVLVPFIRDYIGGMGYSILAGILVLALMILPTISSLCVDAIKSVPKEHIEASLGLGATRWQTCKNVIVPGAKSGILTGIVLGIARAFGEALAVQMVIGNTVKIVDSFLSPAATMTSIITMDMANTVAGSPWNDALWSLALVLLIISFLFILLIRKIEKRGEI
ncbi:MAG: phosphate ABC transporter permease subunit PstC [Clostridium sp.]|uniref:phosphate ABC transporter permease subunit PstC n=1 Tax=Clostridium sp. DSM 8431 TaxID=1761781 RepID=UPI0008EAEC38|nr:phosphate ABC transporter permease subunit PstC [Clostridium sp. DSM 8431]MCR4944791.1 phosphate ABC transporter permease subunit PstC [Clostridium sp.]SFU54582.1 phosphate ABC transporter membrane protein 1, PhoT family [Clostridium sp. DSM 8431]